MRFVELRAKEHEVKKKRNLKRKGKEEGKYEEGCLLERKGEREKNEG